MINRAGGKVADHVCQGRRHILDRWDEAYLKKRKKGDCFDG